MKTKEYIKKYKLDESKFFDRKEFINDLTKDLVDYFQPMILKDYFTMNGWSNCIRMLKQKWDGIFNKSCLDRKSSDSFWKYFYATVVVKLRDFYFPRYSDEIKKQKEERERKKRMYGHYNDSYRYSSTGGFEDFFHKHFDSFLNNLLNGSKTTQCLNILELSNDSLTVENIKNAYRTKSMKHHPDRGGNQEEFIKITNAKDYLLTRIK